MLTTLSRCIVCPNEDENIVLETYEVIIEYFQSTLKRNEILKTQFNNASITYQTFIPIAGDHSDESFYSLYSDHTFVIEENKKWNLHRFILERRYNDKLDFDDIPYLSFNTSVLLFSWLYSAYIPKMKDIKEEVYSLIELLNIFNVFINSSSMSNYCYVKIRDNLLNIREDDDLVQVFTRSAERYIDIIDETIIKIFRYVFKQRRMNNLNYRAIMETLYKYRQIYDIFQNDDKNPLPLEYDEFENMELFINDINFLFNNEDALYDCVFDFGDDKIIYAHKAIIHHFIPYLHSFIKVKNNEDVEIIDMTSYDHLSIESFRRLLKYYYTMDIQFNMENEYKQVIDLYTFIELFILKNNVEKNLPNIDQLYGVCKSLIFNERNSNIINEIFKYVSHCALNRVTQDSMEEDYHCEIYGKILIHLFEKIKSYDQKEIDSLLDNQSKFLLKMYRIL